MARPRNLHGLPPSYPTRRPSDLADRPPRGVPRRQGRLGTSGGAVLQVLVLGAAAGGGFPQWNSNNEASQRARRGDPLAPPSSQSSVAVSADGERWVLLNASPDLRQQIFERRQLHPREGVRHSPIHAVVLTNGDVDHVTGLLSLRERHPLAVYARGRVLSVQQANAIFNVLNPECVERRQIGLGETFEPAGRPGEGLGLALTPVAVPGKVALYLEDEQAAGGNFGTVAEDTIALRIETLRSNGADVRRFLYVPACAALSPVPAPMSWTSASLTKDRKSTRLNYSQ